MTQKKETIFGMIILFCLFGILLYRSFHSFCWSDESLYMAEVHRLYLGECPIVDEWHPTQFFAALFLPVYRLYVMIMGSTQGIYLFARIFHLILAFLTAQFVVYVMQKCFFVKSFFAVAGGMLVMLYSRANVGGLSYHNLFLLEFIISLMLFCYADFMIEKEGSIKHRYPVSICLSGVIMGMAVITIPTLLPFLGILFFYCIKKKNLPYHRNLIYLFFSGIAVAGLFYFLFLFSRITPKELLENLSYIFMDSSHKKSFVDKIKEFLTMINHYGKYMLLTILGILFIKGIYWIRKKKLSDFSKITIFVASCGVLSYNIYISANSHMNSYIPFAMYSLT